MATQAHSSHDPAHASQPNTNHTNSAGEKPTSAIDAILDPEFLPTLDEAPRRQQAKSHALLVALVAGAVFSAWFLGFDLLQVEGEWMTLAAAGGGAVMGVLGLLWWTGALWIDWYALIAGYWWLSLPVGAAAVLVLVMMQEQATGLGEVE